MCIRLRVRTNIKEIDAGVINYLTLQFGLTKVEPITRVTNKGGAAHYLTDPCMALIFEITPDKHFDFRHFIDWLTSHEPEITLMPYEKEVINDEH